MRESTCHWSRLPCQFRKFFVSLPLTCLEEHLKIILKCYSTKTGSSWTLWFGVCFLFCWCGRPRTFSWTGNNGWWCSAQNATLCFQLVFANISCCFCFWSHFSKCVFLISTCLPGCKFNYAFVLKFLVNFYWYIYFDYLH